MDSCNQKATHHLNEVRQFAQSKIATGQEPPWAWYQYMKLIETVDVILGGMDCTITTENLQQSEQRQDGPLRLVDSTYQQDTAQCRPLSVPVHLPM